jgi:exopolyphosphatase / guanosine-5'-triphosphate,3'-diphosphate pyrophosphatase
MEAAEVVPGEPTRVLASEREVTRLGESVFRSGSVSEDAMRQSCDVLARMAALYRKLGVAGVRAVATSAIRDTRNPRQFVTRASEAAGTPVEIISGREEARLIHLGVDSVWPQPGKRALVIDIGGGSAEIIAAEDRGLREGYSKPLGAVRLRENFLRDDPPAERQLRQMEEYIEEKLESAVRRLGAGGWDRAIATSATAATVTSAIAGTARAERDSIDRKRVSTAQVRRLYAELSRRNLAGRRKFPGIGPRRAEIIVPGVAVLLAFLREFKLSGVYYSRAGVRDGIIADLAARNVGAELSRLTRDQRAEVESMCRRYGVSLESARKVARLSSLLFTALHPLHGLPPPAGRLLEAAAYLCDVGHYISSVGHHKHSYYVVSHADMPGFTERERLLIATMCRYHRKSLPAQEHSLYQALAAEEKHILTRIIPVLRLADNLDRSHGKGVESLQCRLRDGEVALAIRSKGDIDLEEWGAERASYAFQQVYNRVVTLTKARG